MYDSLIFFLFTIELKTIKYTTMSHTVALGDMYYITMNHFRKHPLAALHTGAPNVDLLDTENSPQPMHWQYPAVLGNYWENKLNIYSTFKRNQWDNWQWPNVF